MTTALWQRHTEIMCAKQMSGFSYQSSTEANEQKGSRVTVSGRQGYIVFVGILVLLWVQFTFYDGPCIRTRRFPSTFVFPSRCKNRTGHRCVYGLLSGAFLPERSKVPLSMKTFWKEFNTNFCRGVNEHVKLTQLLLLLTCNNVCTCKKVMNVLKCMMCNNLQFKKKPNNLGI